MDDDDLCDYCENGPLTEEDKNCKRCGGYLCKECCEDEAYVERENRPANDDED